MDEPISDHDKRVRYIRLQSLLARQSSTRQRNLKIHEVDAELVVRPGVFPSDLGEGTRLLRQALEARRKCGSLTGKSVLEVGTGAGVVALCAVAAGASSVVATDICPRARQNAAINFDRHDVAKRIRLIDKDVDIFDGLKDELQDGEQLFDLIVFNPPFIGGEWAFTLLAEQDKDFNFRTVHDPGRRTLLRFLAEAPLFLKDGGGVLLAYSDDMRPEAFLEVTEALGYEHTYEGSSLELFGEGKDESGMVFFVVELRIRRGCDD